MSANISRNPSDLDAYNFYYTDTIDYYEELLNTIKVKGDQNENKTYGHFDNSNTPFDRM